MQSILSLKCFAELSVTKAKQYNYGIQWYKIYPNSLWGWIWTQSYTFLHDKIPLHPLLSKANLQFPFRTTSKHSCCSIPFFNKVQIIKARGEKNLQFCIFCDFFLSTEYWYNVYSTLGLNQQNVQQSQNKSFHNILKYKIKSEQPCVCINVKINLTHLFSCKVIHCAEISHTLVSTFMTRLLVLH